MQPNNLIPVVILAGGEGTRLREKTETIPKPMIHIGSKPILWHIMKIYAAANIKRFIVALGYKGDVIKNYFLNYQAMQSNLTIDLRNSDQVRYENGKELEDWVITLADTNQKSMTGSRIAQLKDYLSGPEFMVTYGDGVADVDIQSMLDYHRSHGKIGTLLGIHETSRYGKLGLKDNTDMVHEFSEKPLENSNRDYINGGFFIFNREFLDYLTPSSDCILEREPLMSLANDEQLMVYKHEGFWQCMDTYRDWRALNDLWATHQAPWHETTLRRNKLKSVAPGKNSRNKYLSGAGLRYGLQKVKSI